jgi:cell division septation protein DedD
MTSAANIRVALAAYPMPRLRPTTPVAAAASAPIPLAPPAPTGLEVAETTASTELPETAAAFASASVAQIIGANSIFALEAIDELEQQGDAGGHDEDIEAAAPAPATAMSGWKIQIAATPTQSSAEELLQAARAKAPTVLADVSPYTEPVQAGNATLYRARFGGFASKETARDACAYLTRKNFNCLAISN